MSEYGLKIKNVAAAILYEANLGVREYFDYTDAMLNNSLFLYYMREHGLKVHNNESTRDVICLSFNFGTKDYENECKRIDKMIKDEKEKIDIVNNTDNIDDVNMVDNKNNINNYNKNLNKLLRIKDRIEKNKDKYHPLTREELRRVVYENGIDATYTNHSKDADGNTITSTETIHYKYLFRTPAKAKVGKAMFINAELYDVAKTWLTMDLDRKMPYTGAKIVELSAYSSLTVSSIIDRLYIPINDIVILKDRESSIRTVVDIVRSEDYSDDNHNVDETEQDGTRKIDNKDNNKIKKRCVVSTEEYDVVNTLWDGQGLIDESIMPSDSNGMVLLRNHFFKMCGFRTELQLFFKDWCEKTGNDYDTYEIVDMFGYSHRLKDIKVLTTDNAIKWKKFSDLMGNDLKEAYDYWCMKIKDDGCLWGIVKTDHPSKLGQYQQMSYQMVNTLPCTKEDINEIVNTSLAYVDGLKNDSNVFEEFLRKNANEVNHFEMLADLYAWNKSFASSAFFKNERKRIINDYVTKLKTGKVFVNADNLTVCGNPYALLLYSVGEDWENDPTFDVEEDCIQCYTTRFDDGEYLAAFRSPHNSSNNIAYMHNRYSPEMERYFKFSSNIMAVNCIHTTLQARMNGEDLNWV